MVNGLCEIEADQGRHEGHHAGQHAERIVAEVELLQAGQALKHKTEDVSSKVYGKGHDNHVVQHALLRATQAQLFQTEGLKA